ncbi:hypothetical protein [Aquitalea palustris]|uniref:hypothetical protein n=1 Tax=Aquitalea palustris TaxID=2480983 RepID=UPI0011C43A79|nr:hypothetical protein [Aquitalea palustris]
MARFSEFAKKGMGQALVVSKLKSEIRAVIDDLSQDFSDSFGVHVKFTVRPHPLRHWLLTSMSAMTSQPTAVEDSELGLYASADRDGKSLGEVLLANWEQPSTVYPICLKYADAKTWCDDKDSLIVGIQAMLSHPSVGKKLANLLPVSEVNPDGNSLSM